MAITLFVSLLLLISSGFTDMPTVACLIPIAIYFFVIPFVINVCHKLGEISMRSGRNSVVEGNYGRRIVWDYKTKSMSCDERKTNKED